MCLVIRLAAKAVRLGGLGTFGREARSTTSSSPSLRLGHGIPEHHGPARYLEGSLCRRIRDYVSLRPAQLTQTRMATHSNVPPTLSSDQLLLVPLGHTPVAGDRPPHAGPSRLRAVIRPRLSTPPDQGPRFPPVGPAHPDSDGYALKCSSDALE